MRRAEDSPSRSTCVPRSVPDIPSQMGTRVHIPDVYPRSAPRSAEHSLSRSPDQHHTLHPKCVPESASHMRTLATSRTSDPKRVSQFRAVHAKEVPHIPSQICTSCSVPHTAHQTPRQYLKLHTASYPPPHTHTHTKKPKEYLDELLQRVFAVLLLRELLQALLQRCDLRLPRLQLRLERRSQLLCACCSCVRCVSGVMVMCQVCVGGSVATD